MKIYLTHRERMAGLLLIFAALGVVAFVVGAAVKNKWFEQRIAYHTHIVRGEGLREGSPVLLSGVEVGEVGEMQILENNRVDVEMLVRERHAKRIRAGTRAEVKRLLGIGEKRVYLLSPAAETPELPPGAFLPANEPMDILDAFSNVDLAQYLNTMNRAVATMEILLAKLDEQKRLERIMEAFDQMGPTMEQLNGLISDPSVRKTFQGADRLFNYPDTRRAMSAVSNTFDSPEMALLIERMEKASDRLAALLAADGRFVGAVTGADRLLNDGRADRMLSALDKVTNDKRIEQLVKDLAVIADQTAKIGPQIPTMAKEMTATLREAVVVLKALQKTWILDDASKKAKEEIQRQK